ncbi:MAG: hypothetical protein EA351_14375 [Gemmatimonadales bacterium]|nr:MAG: hypothetical protein EA351_14375 [Gemmatimonadales bacterium]
MDQGIDFRPLQESTERFSPQVEIGMLFGNCINASHPQQQLARYKKGGYQFEVFTPYEFTRTVEYSFIALYLVSVEVEA